MQNVHLAKGKATHRNFRKILEGTLLPSIIHKALSSAMERVVWMSRILHIAVLPGIITGKMEEAGGAMVSEDTPLVELETSEGASQALSGLVARMRSDARRQGLDARHILRGASCGWLRLCLCQLVLEVLDSFLKSLGI